MCQSHGTHVMSDQFDAMYYVHFVSGLVFRQDLRPAYRISPPFPSASAGPAECAALGAQGPTHMFTLATLLAVYPDALFVQTHRAPLDALASVSSLITILRDFSDAVDHKRFAARPIDYCRNAGWILAGTRSINRESHLRCKLC